jgi:hypothetical protein
MATLNHIAAIYREEAEKLAELDLPAEVVADTLEGMAGELEDKARAIGFLIRSIEAEADAEKQWAANAAAHAKALQNRADSMREWLAGAMLSCGLERVESPGIRLSFRKSESVAITDAVLIPADLFAAPKTPEPDKTAIKAAIKAGRVVSGAEIVTKQSLQIK